MRAQILTYIGHIDTSPDQILLSITMKLAAATLLYLAAAKAWVVPPPLAHSGSAYEEAEIPACSVNSPHPCSCPAGTSYIYIQTYFSWGANAWSVRNLTGNFSDLSWVPQPIKATIGPDNTVGSFRLTTIAGDVGAFDWLEEITEYATKDDGSFTWAFEVKNVPLKFPNGQGEFAGEWERFEARAASEHQTDVYWTLYGCHTGGTHTFPVFQRYCYSHVNQTLADMGVLKGTTTNFYAEIKMGHRAGALTKPTQILTDFEKPAAESLEYVMARKGVRVELK
ncbi:hypothetical protein HJFPF1_05668 [Paramyrothecium foliicola]|nr:hypothetical protein HJFPF1_05668 [Paramyrothecium foliicola]